MQRDRLASQRLSAYAYKTWQCSEEWSPHHNTQVTGHHYLGIELAVIGVVDFDAPIKERSLLPWMAFYKLGGFMLDWELPQVILYIMILLMISGLIIEFPGPDEPRGNPR